MDQERERPVGRGSGKVILLGEHAVVYGVPALAVGIDRGAYATAAIGLGPQSVLSIRAWNVLVTEDDTTEDLGRAFRALLGAAKKGFGREGPVRVEAHAELPPGGGLGCSAALGVAIARALVPQANPDEAATLAMAWEQVFHGNPSGIDAAVAAHGGSVLFEKERGLETVCFKDTLTLCIGSTGVPSSTKAMVDGLAQMRERKPQVVGKALEGIRSLVRNARLALEAGDEIGLGKLMDLNQMILSGLFLSTEEIERLCGLARDAGALGAKLTGAGGGGSVVALAVAGKADRILEAWNAAGFSGFSARVHGTASTRKVEEVRP
jgi:mevalonate kinase